MHFSFISNQTVLVQSFIMAFNMLGGNLVVHAVVAFLRNVVLFTLLVCAIAISSCSQEVPCSVRLLQ